MADANYRLALQRNFGEAQDSLNGPLEHDSRSVSSEEASSTSIASLSQFREPQEASLEHCHCSTSQQENSDTALLECQPIPSKDEVQAPENIQQTPDKTLQFSCWQLCKAWAVELLSMLLALLALVAIVITLAMHDGQRLPNWPLSISINALVSIFSVVLKGSMMMSVTHAISQLKWSWFSQARPLGDLVNFDSASRGLWGSLDLLARLKAPLASLGAIVTVVSIANDPFIQQVVNYRPCSWPSRTSIATIARINAYRDLGEAHTGAMMASLGLQMQAALYKGVFESFTPLQAICPTGNCTFPSYRTMGMCSDCKDISNRLDLSNSTACGNMIPLPSGVNLTLDNPHTALVLGPDDPRDALGYIDSIKFPYATNIIYWGNGSTYDHLDENATSSECAAYYASLQPTALNCTLNPCVRTYNNSVTSGQKSEKLLSTIDMARTGVTSYSAVPMPCLINGTYYNESALAANGTVYNLNNAWGQGLMGYDSGPPSSSIPPQCYYNTSLLGIGEYLPTFLSGYVQWKDHVGFSEPEWMGQLYDQGNITFGRIDTFWKSIAESMTITMRQSPDILLDVNGTEWNSAAGTAYETDTCLTLDWAWLALPAALITITILFLIMTMIKSRNVVLWKESPLALLMYGLEPDIKDRFTIQITLRLWRHYQKNLRCSLLAGAKKV